MPSRKEIDTERRATTAHALADRFKPRTERNRNQFCHSFKVKFAKVILSKYSFGVVTPHKSAFVYLATK